MSQDTDDRTFEPTDQRKEEFRRQGRFAKARDACAVVATAAVIGVLSSSGARVSEVSQRLFGATLGDLGALERLGPLHVIHAAATDLGALSFAAILAAAGGSITIGLAQARFRTYGELLAPDLARLDPRQGLTRLLSPKRAVAETAVAIVRVALVGAVAWHALSSELPMLVALARMPLGAAIPVMLGAIGRMAAMSTAALFTVAAIDYAQSAFTLAREMRMTRKEREDEARQSDGDPKAKARMKARARALARKRALTAVKSADVIVTNPTHVAVALRYGPKDPAPVVIAKGHDEIALRIRAEARKYGVPILENRRLARALDAEVPIGRPVPALHFAAVARVLAFVYRLPGRRPRHTARKP